MTPVEMYNEFLSYLDAGDEFFSGAEVWAKLDAANREIVRTIAQQDATYYVQSTTLTTVADQALYDLPLNARLGSRILFTEDVSSGLEIPPVQELKEHLDFNAPGLVNLTSSWHFIMEGNQVRIMPTPGAAGESIRVWYIPSFGQMIQGKISAFPSTTTFDWWAGDPNYTTNFGTPDPRDDYYNGMMLMVTKNTGIGETKTVSDYTGGATRRITVSAAFTATLVATTGTETEVALLSPVPEDFHQMVPLRAAIDGAVKNRNRLDDLMKVYYGSPGRAGLERDLLGWLNSRQDAMLGVVVPIDTASF